MRLTASLGNGSGMSACMGESRLRSMIDGVLVSGDNALTRVFVDSNQALHAGRFYLVNALFLLNLSLPIDPSEGDRIALYSYASGLWRLNCSGHSVEVGDKRTGVNGYIDSKNLGDFLELEFKGKSIDRWICTKLNGYIDLI